MTWNELIKAIQERIPAEKRDKAALYVEPYDDDREAYEVDLYQNPCNENVKGIARDDFFLQ